MDQIRKQCCVNWFADSFRGRKPTYDDDTLVFTVCAYWRSHCWMDGQIGIRRLMDMRDWIESRLIIILINECSIEIEIVLWVYIGRWSVRRLDRTFRLIIVLGVGNEIGVLLMRLRRGGVEINIVNIIEINQWEESKRKFE